MAEMLPVPTETNPNIPDIVQRYLNGESMLDIAKDSPAHPRTLYRWMLAECGEQYDEIVTTALTNRIADADVSLLTSVDSCQVARAREIAKFARMDLERRRPKLYGPKQEITHQGVTVVVNRSAPQPVVVESVGHEVEASSTSQPVDVQALSKSEQFP